ncbi:hypothetical protein QTP70_021423 [Hemibagrus guttatus]|uniref:Uncharacterized protein n=1 Tax=Hemibagrus guttatus TaxID=175788 RepID=A0AAE0URZ3_9TELE|nr:hypothetical protein QTP70_021423 [Hemibagrus guttatus]
MLPGNGNFSTFCFRVSLTGSLAAAKSCVFTGCQQVLRSRETKSESDSSFIVYRLSDLFSGRGEPVPISGVIGHQGRIHPGRSANPSQGTHTLSFTHIILETPINLQCMSLDRGKKPGVHGGIPRGTGRTCKLQTHGGGGNQTPNPGGNDNASER